MIRMKAKLTEKGKQLLYFIRSGAPDKRPVQYEVYCSACKRQNHCASSDIGGKAKPCKNFVMIETVWANMKGKKEDE